MKKALTMLSLTLALVLPAQAGAQVTIGELAPPNPVPYCINGPYDGAPVGPAAPTYTAPISGTVTSWSTNATLGAGQRLTFKIYRPVAPGRYLIVGHDGPRDLVPGVLNTFSTSLPIQAGDLIGSNDLNADDFPNACLFETGNPADAVFYTEGDFPDGATIEPEGFEEGVRFNLKATILPPPTLASLAPSRGSFKGGSSVVLTGSNLAQVSGVSFGGVPAQFTVNSESQVTAVSPPVSKLGSVPVTLTTAAGTATSPQLFAYEGCRVPKLKGKKLKGAKKRLRRADCRVGKVKKRGDATAKTGEVVKQRPKPGKLLPPNAKVKVTLG
ncbi:MAG TPA: IPT/TIG domain-containing protein [Solirubrobacterales bacterium]|nr:IPT/TIG domain-containing protein [Solirubrobacterales bacterium]